MNDSIDVRFNKINENLRLAKEKGDNHALIWCVQALTTELRAVVQQVEGLKGK